MLRSSIVAVAGIAATCTNAGASFIPFSGPLLETRAQFHAAALGTVPMESFDSYPVGAVITAVPSLNVYFETEYGSGLPAPPPVIVGNSPITPDRWVGNTGNGRPPWSDWVIRPNSGVWIHVFGLATSQGDWVRIDAFNQQNLLVGSVESLPISHCFAGFITTTPIARVVITPLGDADGINGLDDLQIRMGVVPAPSASVLGLFAAAWTCRRRRV